MAQAASTIEAMQPLPLAPAGSVPVAGGVDFLEGDEGGSVFVWGMAAWCWTVGDDTARRLAAAQLVESGAASQRQVAAVFEVNETTLWRWRCDYAAGGALGLAPKRKGPKGPSKLTEGTVERIRELRGQGQSFRQVAAAVGVSTFSVQRAMCGPAPADNETGNGETGDGVGLELLARPEARDQERQAARRGELVEAEPRITEGASLPLAGALVILPALAVTGLIDCVERTYGKAKAAFYGLRSLVLTVMFAALLGEPRAEGLTRVDPTDLGRLLGLDRAPEVTTLRRRMTDLAAQGQADALLRALAQRHAAAHPEALGVLYVDGHVRAYHGSATLPKAHVARMRLSMPAEVDTWLADARGDALLVWSAPPGASLAGELRRVTGQIRDLVGVGRRPTIVFDRGGWSPRLFAELDTAGFDILTYRKAPKTGEPAAAFSQHTFIDDTGRAQRYHLADRRVRLAYQDNHRRSRRFGCRQITRLDPDTGHQTQIITTRDDCNPAPVAHAMFSRWRQENFFRYMRHHYALDGLDAYDSIDDDPNRLVANPARRAADAELRAARAELESAEAAEGRATLTGSRTPAERAEIADAYADAQAHIDRLATTARAIAAKVPLAEVRPDAARLDPERKRIHDAIRMATYNAETALARLLTPHYPRARDEARSLLHEIFAAPADLKIIGDELHVRINPLSAPRRTRALTALCDDLTATQTTYPGTNLTLIYTTKNNP